MLDYMCHGEKKSSVRGIRSTGERGKFPRKKHAQHAQKQQEAIFQNLRA